MNRSSFSISPSEESEEDYSEYGGSDSDSDSDDSEWNPTQIDLDATSPELSINRKSKPIKVEVIEPDSETDQDEMEVSVANFDGNDLDQLQKIVQAGQLQKLKVDKCRVYLRKNGLRVTGKKDALIKRIREHLEISSDGGEKKYPMSSFVVNCKGDACTGDVVMFEQKVYKMGGSGRPCGRRIVVGRIVKDSYGAAKQQHTFTIEVLWSKGEKPLPLLHPLLVKGRNLYRTRTLRQVWENEGERQKVIMEKHLRGSLARLDREARVQGKKKMEKKACRVSRKNVQGLKLSKELQIGGLSINLGRSAIQPQHEAAILNLGRAVRPQHSCSFVPPPLSEVRESGSQDVQYQRDISFHRNYRQPSFAHHTHYQAPNNKCRGTHQLNRSSNGNHRQPLNIMNSTVVSQPRQQGQQLCRYYSTQGRCHYGDNCKFSRVERKV